MVYDLIVRIINCQNSWRLAEIWIVGFNVYKVIRDEGQMLSVIEMIVYDFKCFYFAYKRYKGQEMCQLWVRKDVVYGG